MVIAAGLGGRNRGGALAGTKPALLAVFALQRQRRLGSAPYPPEPAPPIRLAGGADAISRAETAE
jgi:hypothetical protein